MYIVLYIEGDRKNYIQIEIFQIYRIYWSNTGILYVIFSENHWNHNNTTNS